MINVCLHLERICTNVIWALLLHVINPENSLNDFKMRTQQMCYMADCHICCFS